jgi:hypothetical protein
MKYIKFLFLSFATIVAMSCDPDQSDRELSIQRFPEAAFYEGDLTEQVGEEQTTFPVYIEMHRRDDGLYNFSIGDVGTDISMSLNICRFTSSMEHSWMVGCQYGVIMFWV